MTHTPRLISIALHMPAHVSDQEGANAIHRLMRQACRPGSNAKPGAVYPDEATLEVHVRTIDAETDREIRDAVFAPPGPSKEG